MLVTRNLLSLRKHIVHSVRWLNTPKKLEKSYYFRTSNVPLIDSTIGDVVNAAADKAGDDVAWVFRTQNVRKTFSEFKNEVDDLASGMIALGLQRGDRIIIWGPNTYEWVLTQFAAAKAGLVLVTLNPAAQAREVEYCLTKTGCRAIVASETFKTQNYHSILCDVSPEILNSKPGQLSSSKFPSLQHVIIINDNPLGGSYTFKSVCNAGGSDSKKQLAELESTVQFDDPALIMFTSGTTGSPKGALLSHFNVLNNANFVGRTLNYHKEKPKICCQVPLFHCYGSVVGTLMTVSFQGSCIFPALSFQPKESLETIESERCTVLYGTPTMHTDVIQQFISNKRDVSSLKTVVTGGSVSFPELVETIKKTFGVQNVVNLYGSTENSPCVTGYGCNDLAEKQNTVGKPIDYVENLYGTTEGSTCTTIYGCNDLAEKQYTAGRPLDYIEVKIIDENKRIVPCNKMGELLVRGHNIFLCYWDDEEKTKEVVDAAGWYHTGDLAIMDEDGYISIVGRAKEMIIRGGENIYPAEIEDFLLTHPDIIEAQVVGVPDDRMGEELCAWVRTEKHKQLTEDVVKNYCRGKISHFKIPRYIIFVDDFPKTLSGKIQKFMIRKKSIEMLQLQEKDFVIKEK